MAHRLPPRQVWTSGLTGVITFYFLLRNYGVRDPSRGDPLWSPCSAFALGVETREPTEGFPYMGYLCRIDPNPSRGALCFLSFLRKQESSSQDGSPASAATSLDIGFNRSDNLLLLAPNSELMTPNYGVRDVEKD
jgi:hypothetical protein